MARSMQRNVDCRLSTPCVDAFFWDTANKSMQSSVDTYGLSLDSLCVLDFDYISLARGMYPVIEAGSNSHMSHFAATEFRGIHHARRVWWQAKPKTHGSSVESTCLPACMIFLDSANWA